MYNMHKVALFLLFKTDNTIVLEIILDKSYNIINIELNNLLTIEEIESKFK